MYHNLDVYHISGTCLFMISLDARDHSTMTLCYLFACFTYSYLLNTHAHDICFFSHAISSCPTNTVASLFTTHLSGTYIIECTLQVQGECRSGFYKTAIVKLNVETVMSALCHFNLNYG